MIKLIEIKNQEHIIHFLNEKMIVGMDRKDNRESEISTYYIATDFYFFKIEIEFSQIHEFEHSLFNGSAVPYCGVTNEECGIQIKSFDIEKNNLNIHLNYENQHIYGTSIKN